MTAAGWVELAREWLEWRTKQLRAEFGHPSNEYACLADAHGRGEKWVKEKYALALARAMQMTAEETRNLHSKGCASGGTVRWPYDAELQAALRERIRKE